MKDFWEKFSINRYWFVGTLCVLLILFLFLWHLVDPDGYISEINSFLQSLKSLFTTVMALAIVIIIVALIVKNVFGKKTH